MDKSAVEKIVKDVMKESDKEKEKKKKKDDEKKKKEEEAKKKEEEAKGVVVGSDLGMKVKSGITACGRRPPTRPSRSTSAAGPSTTVPG